MVPFPTGARVALGNGHSRWNQQAPCPQLPPGVWSLLEHTPCRPVLNFHTQPSVATAASESRSLVVVLHLRLQLLIDVVHQHAQQLLLQHIAAHDQHGQLHGVCPVQVPEDCRGLVDELLLLRGW